MKQLVALMVVVCLLCHSLVPVGITLYYHLNKTSIVRQLCENRSNPSLHCDGKCFLKKQLKQAEENEQKQNNSLLREKEELMGTHDVPAQIAFHPCVQITKRYALASSLYQSNALRSLLKPPLV